MKEEIKAILGKHKVIGDTTYGLGYAEAEQLANELVALFTKKIEQRIIDSEETIVAIKNAERRDIINLLRE